ncbi:hypothetical protein R1flu_020575 [Riccia fluitans]|uniref:Uncharacterized protein n=1 Tax=Riccia fluitans TaxID=41844 RepID=A0ABD1ZN39_9MARC
MRNNIVYDQGPLNPAHIYGTEPRRSASAELEGQPRFYQRPLDHLAPIQLSGKPEVRSPSREGLPATRLSTRTASGGNSPNSELRQGSQINDLQEAQIPSQPEHGGNPALPSQNSADKSPRKGSRPESSDQGPAEEGEDQARFSDMEAENPELENDKTETREERNQD